MRSIGHLQLQQWAVAPRPRLRPLGLPSLTLCGKSRVGVHNLQPQPGWLVQQALPKEHEAASSPAIQQQEEHLSIAPCRQALETSSSSNTSSGCNDAASSADTTALTLVSLGAAISLATLLLPAAAGASDGTFTGQSAELFQKFLESVASLGPWGSVLFVTVVMLFEMVPLFPTQPLSLASGLLFGAQEGAILMLIGVTLAATNAFFIARGVGRPLAQKVIDAEMGHEGNSGAMAKTMANVQAAIEGGGLWKQLTAIFLLRLTPVVPFSASNYLLGLTPLQLPAFVGGTVLGMSVWSVLYASLGGASRKLLDGGADMETLLADLSEKAGAMSSNILNFTVVVALGGLATYLVRTYLQWPSNEEGSLTSMDEPSSAGQRGKRYVDSSVSDQADGQWLGSTWSQLTRSWSADTDDEPEEPGRRTATQKRSREKVHAQAGRDGRK